MNDGAFDYSNPFFNQISNTSYLCSNYLSKNYDNKNADHAPIFYTIAENQNYNYKQAFFQLIL